MSKQRGANQQKRRKGPSNAAGSYGRGDRKGLLPTGRREFFAVISIGLVAVTGVLIRAELVDESRFVLRQAAGWLKERFVQSGVRQHRHLAAKLFFPGTTFSVLAADGHPTLKIPEGHATFSNEEYAEKAIRSFTDLDESTNWTDQAFPVPDTEPKVIIGSSISNSWAQMIFGPPDDPRFEFQDRVRFPYSIQRVEGRTVRLQDGKEHVSGRYLVVGADGERVGIPEITKADELRSDTLLVTRLPDEKSGSDVVILAGLHGPAIQAIKQLLFDLDVADLTYLTDKVRGFPFPYYQAVFRVDGLVQADDTTRPTSLSLIRGTVQRVKMI